MENLADAGAAAGMSLKSPIYVPGKLTYVTNVANYGKESAMGVSLRKTADSGRWSVIGGVSATTEGTPGFKAGIAGVIN